MVVSLAIVSIVLVAMAAAVMLCARSMEAVNSGSVSQEMQAQSIAAQVAADLKVALAFTQRSNTSCTFTVPDRDGDGQPEIIRYSWAGAGQPLMRQVTSAGNTTTGTLAGSVQSFDMNWASHSVGPPVVTLIESAEQALISHNGAAGSNIKSYAITTTNWVAEYFKPTLPAGTTSWKITKIKLMLARNGSAITALTVQVRNADAQQKPGSTLLDSATVLALNLGATAGYVDVPFSNLTNLDPTLGYVVSVTTISTPSPANMSYDSASTDSGMSYTTTSNAGSSWATPSTGNALQYYVYGTYTAPQ
jgi:hypothetical protein